MEELKEVGAQNQLINDYLTSLQMLTLNSRLKEVSSGVAIVHLDTQEKYFQSQLEKTANAFLSDIPWTYDELYNKEGWDRDDYISNLTIILKEHPELLDFSTHEVYELVYSILGRSKIKVRYKEFISTCKGIMEKREEFDDINELLRINILNQLS